MVPVASIHNIPQFDSEDFLHFRGKTESSHND